MCLCAQVEVEKHVRCVTLPNEPKTWRAPVSRLPDTSSVDKDVKAAHGAGSEPISSMGLAQAASSKFFTQTRLQKERNPDRSWVQWIKRAMVQRQTLLSRTGKEIAPKLNYFQPGERGPCRW